jgi:hypothetical protein
VEPRFRTTALYVRDPHVNVGCADFRDRSGNVFVVFATPLPDSLKHGIFNVGFFPIDFRIADTILDIATQALDFRLLRSSISRTFGAVKFQLRLFLGGDL